MWEATGEEVKEMKIAVPIENESICAHFGHCRLFRIFEVSDGNIVSSFDETPPPHSPGILPAWLKDLGVDVVLTGGMGERAKAMLVNTGVEVLTGVSGMPPEKAVREYLAGTLKSSGNLCDH